jgi:hypothetical protein
VAHGLFYSGLDCGQAKDFCALACVKRVPNPTPRPKRAWAYDVLHLESWELGTSYVDIVGDVEKRFTAPQLRGSNLVPDATGLGRPMCDLLRSRRVKARVVPVTTTAGKLASRNDETGIWNVPKAELVTTLQLLMQDALVQVDSRLKLAPRLKKELQEFRVKITSARNETFGAEASQHDDLVFSLMLAVWLGERDGGGIRAGIGTPPAGEGSIVETAPDGVFLSPAE